MTTSYDLIFTPFYKMLEGEVDFFYYEGLTDEETANLIEDKSKFLLDQAISLIYKKGNPDINLNDKDDANRIFNIILVHQEISLIQDIMYYKYFDKKRNKLSEFGITYKNSELNVLSPANERKSFLQMVASLESDITREIKNYLNRDRETWEFKSVYNTSEATSYTIGDA